MKFRTIVILAICVVITGVYALYNFILADTGLWMGYRGISHHYK